MKRQKTIRLRKFPLDNRAFSIMMIAALAIAILFSGCSADISNPADKGSGSRDAGRAAATPSNSAQSSNSSSSNPASSSGQASSSSSVKPGETEPPPRIGTIPKVTLDEELQKVIETEIKLSGEANTAVQKFISGVRTNYQHEELFGIEAALERYYAIKKYETTSNEFITNGRLDRQKLRDRIKANNDEYLSSHSGNFYSAYSDADFSKLFGIFADTIDYWLGQADAIGIDINGLDEKLGYVKLLAGGMVEGHVSNEGDILALNLSAIAGGQNAKPELDWFKNIAIHETNHFIQNAGAAAMAYEGYDLNVGLFYKWEDLTVNPLYWSWYIEGAAEKLKLEAYGQGAEVTHYDERVRALESIMLATILNEDYGIATAEKLSLQRDLDRFFTLLNCRTEEDKKEIVKMMYALEINFNESKDFFDAYESRTGSRMDSGDRRSLGFSYRASAAGTLAKVFYSDLANRMSAERLRLEDVFMLISAFEIELSRLTWYSSDGDRLRINMEFISNYASIQDRFFSELSEESGIGIDMIVKAYNAYHASSSPDSVQISFLSADENRAISELLTDRLRFNPKQRSINEVYSAIG